MKARTAFVLFWVLWVVVGWSKLGAADDPTVAFPQFVSGEGNTTRIILRNNDDVADMGQIFFRDQAGNPATVSIGGINRTGMMYSLPPYGVLDIVTDGTGPLRSGSVAVVSNRGPDSMLEGSLVFSLLGYRTSVPAADTRTTNQVFVTRNANENTGFAAFNPSDSESITVIVKLVDATGADRATEQFDLAPLQRVAVFVDDSTLFKTFFDALPAGSSFLGTLNAACTHEVAIVGLVQDLHDFSLITTETSENGSFPPILGPPPVAAALCGCSAEIDASEPSRVKVRYGMEGALIGDYVGDNRLFFDFLQDNTPLTMGSAGQEDITIRACGAGFFNALGLNSFPTANQIRLTFTKGNGSDPIQCVARFRN